MNVWQVSFGNIRNIFQVSRIKLQIVSSIRCHGLDIKDTPPPATVSIKNNNFDNF